MLGVEEIDLCCVLNVNSQLTIPAQVLISLYISARYFFYQRLSGFCYNLTIVSKIPATKVMHFVYFVSWKQALVLLLEFHA